MKSCVAFLILALVAASNADNRADNSACPRMCHRMWRPVCAKLNGLSVDVPNRCVLDNLIECVSADNEIWEYLHEGPCQNANSEEMDSGFESALGQEDGANSSDDINEDNQGEAEPIEDEIFEDSLDASEDKEENNESENELLEAENYGNEDEAEN